VEEASELVRDRMEHAFELDVPLRADIGWGALPTTTICP